MSKRLITIVFESSEPLCLLRLNGCLSAIPTDSLILTYILVHCRVCGRVRSMDNVAYMECNQVIFALLMHEVMICRVLLGFKCHLICVYRCYFIELILFNVCKLCILEL